jgi:sortase A
MLVLLSVAGIALSGCSRAKQPEPTSTPKPTAAVSDAANPAPPIGPPRLSRPFDGGVMPDRLELPAIDLDTPVVELGWYTEESGEGEIFSQWEVADNAAGWHKNSALLGDGGNLVLSGHNNIRGAVFRELDRLKKGDQAILWASGHNVRYIVEQVMIVPEKYASPEQRAANAEWIAPSEDDRLTLVSCWPRDDNSHRIIVVARPAESVAESVVDSER